MNPLSPSQNKSILTVMSAPTVPELVDLDSNMVISPGPPSANKVTFADIFALSGKSSSSDSQSDHKPPDVEIPLPPDQSDQEVSLAESSTTSESGDSINEAPVLRDLKAVAVPRLEAEAVTANPAQRNNTKQGSQRPLMDHISWVRNRKEIPIYEPTSDFITPVKKENITNLNNSAHPHRPLPGQLLLPQPQKLPILEAVDHMTDELPAAHVSQPQQVFFHTLVDHSPPHALVINNPLNTSVNFLKTEVKSDTNGSRLVLDVPSNFPLAYQIRSQIAKPSIRPNQVETADQGDDKDSKISDAKAPTLNFLPEPREFAGSHSTKKINARPPFLEVLATGNPNRQPTIVESGETRPRLPQTLPVLPARTGGSVNKTDHVPKNAISSVSKMQFRPDASSLPVVPDHDLTENQPALKTEGQWISRSVAPVLPMPTFPANRPLNIPSWRSPNELLDLSGHDPMSVALRESQSVAHSANPTQVLRHELPPMVARQLADVIAQAPSRPVEITLSPMELGNVRLSINISEAGITVNLIAERPETLDLFRRHIDQLGHDLQSLGYREIAFSFAQGNRDHRSGDDAQKVQVSDAGNEEDATINADAQKNQRQGQTNGLDLRL